MPFPYQRYRIPAYFPVTKYCTTATAIPIAADSMNIFLREAGFSGGGL